jgi:rubrerythrin
MNRIGTSKENLAAAISGEKYEFTEMYPGFMEQAEKEGKSEAKDSFDLANGVEQIHHGLFQSAIDELERGQTAEPQRFCVCQYCGNTVEEEAPENCPVCGAAKDNFEKIE